MKMYRQYHHSQTNQNNKLVNAITVKEVTRAIKKLNNNRAAGPDGISARLVNTYPKKFTNSYAIN